MVLSTPDSMQIVCERVKRSARCTAAGGFYRLSFQAMSAACHVNFYAAHPTLAENFQAEVLQWVSWFESRYSRFINDSLISRINAAAGQHWVAIDAETETIFNVCHEMIFFTGGVFDPTSLPLIQLWNWKAK